MHNVARLRARLGLTQAALANKVQCSQSAIQAIETGRLKLSRPLAMRIAKQTGTDPEWLLSEPETNQ